MTGVGRPDAARAEVEEEVKTTGEGMGAGRRATDVDGLDVTVTGFNWVGLGGGIVEGASAGGVGHTLALDDKGDVCGGVDEDRSSASSGDCESK